MPSVRPLTEAKRREYAEKNQRERVARIINSAAVARGMDRRKLAEQSGIEYQTLNGRLRGASDFRLTELISIADALRLDSASRAALAGAAEKCCYEGS